MIDLVFRPLPAPPNRARKRSSFKATWARTLDLLEHELELLGAKDIVVQAGFELSEIRNDGWPRGGVRPKHPAVVLSFRDRTGKPLSFPCDTYDDHEDNLRAIGLSLEALRAVNRYGVTKGNEQYAGFKQIEGPKQWTVDDAAEFLIANTGHGKPQDILQMEELYRSLYRTTAKRLHPDAGGNQYEWKLLADAKALLDAHFAQKGASA